MFDASPLTGAMLRRARRLAAFWMAAACVFACTSQPSGEPKSGLGAGGTLAESGRGGSLAAAGTGGSSGSQSMGGSAGSAMDASAAPNHDPPASSMHDDAGMVSVDSGLPDGSGPAAIDPPSPVGCVTDVSPGVHDFACDDTVHSVSIPAQCISAACGVIIDVHGGMMSSQMEDKNTQLRALGERYGYIVIQPNAQQNQLLLDQRLFVADAPGQPADDTRVMNILLQVMEAFHADEKRIHMTGFSEGGFMSWRWFCQHSDLLASVAPGAAAWECSNLANLGLTAPEVGCELTDSSKPARTIPVLYMQGMRDGLVDPMCADGWIRSHALSALELGDATVIAGDPDFATAKFVRTRYLDPEGVPFEYIQHQYTSDSEFLGVPIVGHCYPGSSDLMVTPPEQTLIPPDQLMSFGCKDDCEFNWGEEVIAFFMAHPKP